MFTESFVVLVDNDYLAAFLTVLAIYLIFERENTVNFNIAINFSYKNINYLDKNLYIIIMC